LTHNSLAANVRFARRNIPLKAKDTILSFLPMAHTFGCTFDFLFPFCVGCHITFLGQIPSPKILVQALGHVRPRLILSVPLLIEKIYKSSIKPKLDKPIVKILSKLPVVGGKLNHKVRQSLVDVFGGNFIEIVIGGAALNAEVENFLRKIDFSYSVGYGMTECGPLISYTPASRFRTASVGQ
ncbi:MAG: long-chain fatty acid--CoA ligase, partial [bacterium]|nr:long-chain fatty acid--CoA ligase [bacterium]